MKTKNKIIIFLLIFFLIIVSIIVVRAFFNFKIDKVIKKAKSRPISVISYTVKESDFDLDKDFRQLLIDVEHKWLPKRNFVSHSFVGVTNSSITMDVPAYVKVASNPARVIGLNSVGMSRNEISSESISLIKKAYKLVYKKGYRLEDAINKLVLLSGDSDDKFLDTFIKSIQSSTRGILR